MDTASQSLGSVLVVGGCGFLGYEIVRLLKESGCSVAVMSRNPRGPRVDGVSYHACDITNVDSLRASIIRIKPRVLIHSASPIFLQNKIDKSALHATNVVGTQNLLDVATTTESVRAFVYSSSAVVHVRTGKSFRTEDTPLIDRSTTSDEYALSKAVADTMVLAANSPELPTLCLRFPAIYGERDTQFLPGSMAVAREGKSHMQLGDNKNLYDAIYVGNAALAHLMAAKALLRADTTLKADGEAFLVTDDAAVPFWDVQRKVWAAGGHAIDLKRIQVIPAWVGMATAAFMEYLFWIFTLGHKLPPNAFRRDVLRYSIEDGSYCIDKAKERLGYRPMIDMDEGIRRGVAWMLDNQSAVSGGKDAPDRQGDGKQDAGLKS
ncbi:MAG: hypothetical protein Q9173_005035 [Seirophora scorigena]